MDAGSCVEYDVGNGKSVRNRVGVEMAIGRVLTGEECEETSGTGVLRVIHVASREVIAPPSPGLKALREGWVNGITGRWSL